MGSPAGTRVMTEPLIEGRDLHLAFRTGRRRVAALRGVSLSVGRGESVGLIGESGSGKTTAALTLMGIHAPDSGEVRFEGSNLAGMSSRELRSVRRRAQMVLQDPYASLDPRWRIFDVIAEPLRAHRYGGAADTAARVRELLDMVALPQDFARRRPGELSGGQRQRVAIARAIAVSPDILVADEPVSALDVSVQAQIVNLLLDIRERTGMSYLTITHDLALLRRVADQAVVMYLGEVVETGSSEDIIARPLHPYTASLVSASPAARAAGRPRIVLSGEAAQSDAASGGCAFRGRCPVAQPQCAEGKPSLRSIRAERAVACFFPGALSAGTAEAQRKALA